MIVITGGGSGIGRALALELAERHEKVLIVGRREAQLQETKAAGKARIDYIVTDLSQEQGRQQLIEHLSGETLIKGLVHNAGLLEPLKPLSAVSLSEWRRAQSINVEAPLFLTQGLLHKLKGQRVLHLSSGAAHHPFSLWGAYCTSKAALYMLYQLFKKEEPDVLFASVMPGVTDTGMQDSIREATDMPKEELAFFRQLKKENKLLSPETVAEFLSWLLLDTDSERYIEREWDIYESWHHEHWVKKGVVHKVFDNE